MSQLIDMPASTWAYHEIKKRILSKDYPPGHKLREISLCKELMLTRTPIREAIIRLQSEGLLSSQPNKGAFVPELSLNEIEELFEVREALEIKAAELATRRANREQLDLVREGLERHELRLASSNDDEYYQPDMDFHEAIVKLCKNKTLSDMWDSMHSRLILARAISGSTAMRYKYALKEHKIILQKIYEGKDYELRKVISDHIAGAKVNLIG